MWFIHLLNAGLKTLVEFFMDYSLCPSVTSVFLHDWVLQKKNELWQRMFLEGRELQDEWEGSLIIGTNLNSTVVSDKLLIWENAERVQTDHIHLDFGLSSISTAQKW